MFKIWLKTCSILLVLALIVNMLPMAVLGQAYRENISSAEQIETAETIPAEDARIVKEITENRTEFSKEFQLSNGLRMAAVYADAVHYETENGWEEIDNTLIAQSDGTYANTAGIWDVRFPDQLTKTKGVTIEKDGYTLSFFMAGELNSDHAVMSATEPVIAETLPEIIVETVPETVVQTEPETVPETTVVTIAETVPETTAETVETTAETIFETIPETTAETVSETTAETVPETTAETTPETVEETTAPTEATLPVLTVTPEISAEKLTLSEIRLSKASVEKVDHSKMKEAAKHPEIVPEKVRSRLSYSNVFANTQIIYDLDSNKVKESIVLNAYSRSLRGYRYTLHTGEMIPVLEESGQILFYDKAQENIVMVMPAPYLIDNAGVYNHDISVALTGGNGTYTLTYTLPQQWLADQDRAWPVILDPVMQADLDVNNIRDRSVAENKTYEQTEGMNSCGYDTDTGIVRFFLKYNNLPAITSSDVVVGATIRMFQGDVALTTTPVEVHKVNANWTSEGITWANQPGHSANIEDYALVDAVDWYGWVVTDIVRDWYANSNTGMLFKASSAVETGGTANYKQFLSSDYGTADSRPVLTITLRNANGLESYWDYTASSAGRAGTGYINNYTGNMTFVRKDIGFGGNRMPVTISHVYNINDVITTSGENNADDSMGNSFGMGVGWRTNYNQLVYPWYLNGEDQDFFIWEDEDGTDHYFKYSSANTYIHENNEKIILRTNGTGTEKYSITFENGYVSYFDTQGRLTKISNNQAMKSDITITYNGPTASIINTITDGAGRVYTFSYTDGLCTRISYQGNTAFVRFIYDSLCPVIFIDTEEFASYYDYSDKFLLLSAENVDGYKLEYTYNIDRANWQPYRTLSVKESYNSNEGGALAFAYGHNQTTITDHDNNVEILRFNDFGNLVSVQDDEGRAQFAQFAFNTEEEKEQNTDSTKKINQMRVASKLQNTVGNRLKNSSFENGSVWGVWPAGTSCENVTTQAYMGTHSLLFTATEWSCILSSSFTIEPGATYTFSAYLKGISGTSTMMIVDRGSMASSQTVATTGSTAWKRVEVSYTNTTSANITCCAQLFGTAGTQVYMDCVQVEKATTASRFNLVENGDFSGNASGWTRGPRLESTDAHVTNTSAAYELNQTVFRISGSPTLAKHLYQRISINGNAGDNYVFGGWAKGDSVPVTSFDDRDRRFALAVLFVNTDGSTTERLVHFNPDMNDGNSWQYAAGVAIADKNYSAIQIEIHYDYNYNTMYFDGIQLYKEEFGSSYTYDSNGNVISVKDLQKQITTYEYDTNSNLTEIIQDNTSKMTYTYDEHHNVTQATTAEGVVYNFTYDTRGNNTSVSIGSGSNKITASATYTQDKNYLATTTDTVGNTTTYTYDTNTGVLLSVKYPQDTDATKTTYTYDDMYYMASAAATTDTGLSMSAIYAQAYDKPISIETPTTTYSFTYGDFRLRNSVKAGNYTLATYSYTDDRNRYLASIDYGNQDSVNYTYDDKGRVTGQTYEDGDSVTYSYDNNGTLAKVQDSATGITTAYYYDLTDRMMQYVESSTGFDHSVGYEYDDLNNLTKLVETINGVKHTTSYTYDDDNRVTSVANGDIGITYTYDEYGRLTDRITSDDGNTEVENYYIYATVNGKPATRISRINHIINESITSLSSGYTYYGDGNIKKFSYGPRSSTYTYDSAGQLLSEDNPGMKYRYEWTYDEAGNIQTRKEYTYITGETNPVLTDSVTYGYDNSTWGDLLTEYDGHIYYDNVGNVVETYYWRYEWEHGRQLARMYKPSVSWNFIYDANGMRTKRTNGTDTYTYVYNGSQLTQMSKGNDTLYFTYDASGTPVSVTHTNGSTSVTYYYVTNLQGDVMHLFDANGTTAGYYIYDAWGNQISMGSSTICQLNPLRYRGYVYDQETELYYLQSRYYNPEWGRFINADNYPTTGQGFTGNNMFAYCGNNPVNRADNHGNAWHLVIGAAVGLVAGLAGQVISDVVTSVLNGEPTISNWQTYTGAAVGGMAGGLVLAATGSVNAANLTTGALTTGVGQSLEKLTIDDYDKSWAEIGVNTVADGAISFGLGKLPGINKITSGRNNGFAVYKSGLTKLRNGTVMRMSTKVIGKGIVSSIVGGFALDGYYGVKQHAYDKIKHLLV